jgi:hypothetical protein
MDAHGESERVAEERNGERLVRADTAGGDETPLAAGARVAEIELELPNLAAAERARELERRCARRGPREVVVAFDPDAAIREERGRGLDR